MKYFYFPVVGAGYRETISKSRLADMVTDKNKTKNNSVAMQGLNSLANKNSIAINDVYVVGPSEWECPDLGPIKNGDLQDKDILQSFYDSAVQPSVDRYFTKYHRNATSKVKLIDLTADEGAGFIGALYQDKTSEAVMDDFMKAFSGKGDNMFIPIR